MLATHAPPTAAVTAFASAVALAAGLGARTAVLAAAVLSGQVSVGWANDYIDAERDRAVARRDKPIATGQVSADVVRRCATAALLTCVPLSLAVGWRPGAAHLVAVGSAWHYNTRLKTTVASWLPYALSFGLLPIVVATALPGQPLPQPLVVAVAAALGVAAHFANTVGDAEDDAATGVRGLPQRVGPHASVAVAAVVVVVAAVLLVLATDAAAPPVVAAGLAVAALPLTVRVALRPAHAGHRFGRPAAFAAVLAATGALVIAFVLAGGHHLTSR